MKELIGLHLQKYVMWPKFDLEFEPGITRIEGPNRSGKSLTFGAMTQALWGSAAAKRGTDASKTPKGSKTSVTFKDGKDTWRVEGTGSSVQIFRNDVSREMSGSKTGRSEFQAVMGMSQDLYDASVVIGAKPNPLTHATPLQRVDWFHSVFGLDQQYDRVLKNVSPLLSAAKKAQETVDALTGERKFILKSAVKPSSGGLSAAELTTVLAGLRKKQAASSAALALFADRRRLAEELAKLPESSISIEEAEKYLEKYRKELKNDDYLVSKMEFRAETKAASDDIKAKLKKLSRHGSYVVSKERHEAVLALLREFEEINQNKWTEWQSQSRPREEASKWKPMKVRDVDTVGQELDSLTREEYALDQRRRELAKPFASVCSECGQTVSKKHRDKERSALAVKHSSLILRLNKVRAEQERANAMRSLTMTEEPPDLRLVQASITRLEETETAEAARKVLNDQLRLLPASTETPDTALPMSEEKRKLTENRVDRLERSIEKTRRRDQVQGAIAKLDVKLAEFKFKNEAAAQKIASKVNDAIDKMERQRDKRLAEESVYASARKSLKAMDERLAEARKAAEPLPVLEAIHRASGRSGLRMTRLKDMVDAFQSYLNEAAPLLWPADHKFLITHDEKGIDIALQRANEVVSDLSVMSQSEGQVWRLLCAYALVRMVPSRMRIDTIVLDELESHMDEPAKLDYAKSFLPALAEAVPKVIVISPMSSSELPIDFDQRYVVETGKSGSRLVKH